MPSMIVTGSPGARWTIRNERTTTRSSTGMLWTIRLPMKPIMPGPEPASLRAPLLLHRHELEVPPSVRERLEAGDVVADRGDRREEEQRHPRRLLHRQLLNRVPEPRPLRVVRRLRRLLRQCPEPRRDLPAADETADDVRRGGVVEERRDLVRDVHVGGELRQRDRDLPLLREVAVEERSALDALHVHL